MIKVEKDDVIKEVTKELASKYVKAGWKIVETKKTFKTLPENR